ncbi:MAG: glycoside hydrolase family 3 N-terminal domain-containing protein [Candidatus Brocadiaceae bacterium]|jgi:beta-glucosidase
MGDPLPYEDASLPVEERVEDLLGRMTLEEKVGQMTQISVQEGPEQWLEERHAGSFLFVLGQRTVNLQKAAENSRLGIPFLFGIDAVHGHAFWPGATVFPTQLGMSCSWNPEMVEEVGRVTAREVRLTGAHWTFSPVCGTARDLRWGRVDETFGEDPYLIGVLASALVRGYQGEDLSDPERILACAKHYAGYSETRGGRDAAEADLSRRSLLSTFLRPFRAVCQAGCATYMTAYQAIDGLPCTVSRWLLTDVLRHRWGFEGFVVTDWDNLGHMKNDQRVFPTIREAIPAALKAGNDMMMNTPAFYDDAIAAVEQGELDENLVDRACRRILRLKFALGLFDENRYPDLEEAEEIIGCEEHRALAREAARQSIVLLKNDDNLLPLSGALERVAVIGPNADDPEAQLGDWSLGCTPTLKDTHPRDSVATVLDGIRERFGPGCRVDYARGCDVKDPQERGIAEATELAAGANVAIVVLGDDTSLNGEGRDRATLELTGAQQELLEAVHATGTPVVLVLVCGKPLSIPWAVEHVPAIVCAFNPGMEGGRAVAEILTGETNPAGKLTVSWPRHVGQQPVYYNQLPGWHTDRYADMTPEPLFRFGHGLSYTSFRCSGLELSTHELREGETLAVQVRVENTGDRPGTEVVQLYVNDLYSSVTTPVKELKAFARVDLEPGESRTVNLEVPYERLALINADLEAAVEPGEFEVMVGGSSCDDDLVKDTFHIVE